MAVSFLWWDRCLARCLAVWNVVEEAEGVHTRHPDTGTEGPPEWGTVAVGVDVVEVVEVVLDMVEVVVVGVVEVVGIGAQW